MKNTNVTLVPLTSNDHEQFILDNQWAFKYGAMIEFGERDNHMEEDDEAFRILENGKPIGGAIVRIDQVTHHNELEILFVTPHEQ